MIYNYASIIIRNTNIIYILKQNENERIEYVEVEIILNKQYITKLVNEKTICDL